MTTALVKINQSQLSQIQSMVTKFPRETKIAVIRSINRTLGNKRGGMHKIIADEIVKDVNIQPSYIYTQEKRYRTFTTRKAQFGKLSGSITTSGANVPLINYSNQRGTHKSYAKKIYVTVQKSRGRKLVKHAWVWTSKSGHRGIFARRNPSDKKDRRIKELYGSRIPDVLSNQPTINRVTKLGSERLARELDHELNFALRRANGR